MTMSDIELDYAPHPVAAEGPESEAARLARMRHSAAHLMAGAVLKMFPEARFGIGPAIEDGFYYDFELPRALTPDDLAEIEARMAADQAANYPYEYAVVSRGEALDLFKDQPYKVELIENLPEDATISTYQHGQFRDLCRGPHVPGTGAIGAFKLLNVAGAYWRGDEHRPMLQRIYGTAFPSQEALDQYLWRRAEAEKRDHRKLGKELELFHFDPTAPGMPYWLPKGFKVLTELINFWRMEHEDRGYQEISAPLINDKSLWETSGHWDHYKENMFLIPVDENVTYGVKPMNCPNAMVVFKLKTRSYRDLPLRLADCDVLHRHERSGTLHGLLRVQKIQQDDAHIFLAEDQLEAEFARILDIADRFYSIFGLKYTLRLGTRPAKFIGDIETWDKAEATLTRILEQHAGPGNYLIEPGDGAFYGPKIDILMEDALSRSWQMGTIQLDFQQPRRFGCMYVDKEGRQQTPVVIHRVIYGSLERFLGILIEHLAGAFPLWLSPVQAVVIPISNVKHGEYAESVRAQLKAVRLRVELDDSSERMGAKIRQAQLQKVPYMLVVGDKEREAGTVSVRLRSGADLGAIPVDALIARLQAEIASRALTSAEN
jgi:threonyl-tRNA synthetase